MYFGICLHRPTTGLTPSEGGCQSRRVYVYFEPHDLWVGVYVADDAVYVCLLPTVVIRLRRGR